MNRDHCYIHPGARLGKQVKVGPFTFIDDDVSVGDGTEIGPNVTIYSGSRIGNDCRIFPGAVIGAIPQDLKFSGEYSTVEIGDRTTIRECVTVNRGTLDRKVTSVGSDTLLMAYVHIAHDCAIGNHCVLANSTNLAGHVLVGDHVVFGGMSAAQQFVKIGKHAFIAGGALLRQDVPPYVIAAQFPVKYAGVNTIGLKRRGFSSDDVLHIQEICRILFNSGLNRKEAADRIERELPQSSAMKDILDFVRTSENGVIRGG